MHQLPTPWLLPAPAQTAAATAVGNSWVRQTYTFEDFHQAPLTRTSSSYVNRKCPGVPRACSDVHITCGDTPRAAVPTADSMRKPLLHRWGVGTCSSFLQGVGFGVWCVGVFLEQRAWGLEPSHAYWPGSQRVTIETSSLLKLETAWWWVTMVMEGAALGSGVNDAGGCRMPSCLSTRTFLAILGKHRFNQDLIIGPLIPLEVAIPKPHDYFPSKPRTLWWNPSILPKIDRNSWVLLQKCFH